MRYSISEIAAALNLTVVGDGALQVDGIAEPAEATPQQLAMAMRPDYADGLRNGAARAAMMWQDADWRSYGLEAAILAPRPRYSLAGLSALMDLGQGYADGVHPSAVIDPSAQLADDVCIGPLSVIGANARIGSGATIGPQVHVGSDVTLGCQTVLHAGVKISARVTVGDRFVAQPGVVIGGDGFSFVTPEPSDAEKIRESLGSEDVKQSPAQAWARIHSLGSVTIGHDVEIGANSAVDRGTVRDTKIGDGCKIDNLVQIGHNVILGRDCLICGHAAIAGSACLGDNVVVAGKAGVADNIRIGNRVVIGAASAVLSHVPDGRPVLGYPAMKMEAHVESYKGLRRLPRLFREVAELKKAVSKLAGKD